MGLPHNGAAGWFLPDQETMAVRKTTKRLYLIPVLSKALDILELVQAENQPMTLEAIHRQTRISKTTVYRVLKTFVHRGYLSQSPDGLYRQVTRPKKLRFGFGGQSAGMPFFVEGTESLKDAGGFGGGGPADSGQSLRCSDGAEECGGVYSQQGGPGDRVSGGAGGGADDR